MTNSKSYKIRKVLFVVFYIQAYSWLAELVCACCDGCQVKRGPLKEVKDNPWKRK